jgi:hypothetical protein
MQRVKTHIRATDNRAIGDQCAVATMSSTTA